MGKTETNKQAPWGFGHFVGQCFSFTQITKQSTKQIEDDDNAKIVLLEERVSKMTKSIMKQNEKIMQLKMENKLIKLKIQNDKLLNSDDNINDNVHLSVNEWKQWTSQQLIQWIISQKGFKKYKSTLQINLNLRKIKGKHLRSVDKSDLTYFYGILDFDDVCELYCQIKTLIQNHPQNVYLFLQLLFPFVLIFSTYFLF